MEPWEEWSLAAENRRENSAAHSRHLAQLVLILAEYAVAPIDIGRNTELVTVHDLVEVYAADTPADFRRSSAWFGRRPVTVRSRQRPRRGV